MKYQDISQIKTREKSFDKIKENFIPLGKSIDDNEINNYNNFLTENNYNNNIENVTKSCIMNTNNNLNNNFNQKSAILRNNNPINSNRSVNNIADLKPILIIDVKLKENLTKNIKVYEGDTSSKLAAKFSEENSK